MLWISFCDVVGGEIILSVKMSKFNLCFKQRGKSKRSYLSTDYSKNLYKEFNFEISQMEYNLLLKC